MKILYPILSGCLLLMAGFQAKAQDAANADAALLEKLKDLNDEERAKLLEQLATQDAAPAAGGSAEATIEEYGGQVLGIAQNVEGVRVLIPAKTFEGRILKDSDLEVLAGIAHIKELDIKNAGITDAGLTHLKGLTELERLHLEKTKVTSAGLEHLSGLSSLQYLNLYGTGVDDDGLAQLKGLSNLKNLYLWQTKVTEEAAKAFHEAMEAAGNEDLEINLGWEKEILSKKRVAALKAQRAALEAAFAGEGSLKEDTEVAVVDDPNFKTHILPIFEANCAGCHGDEKQKADLRLDSFAAILKGNEDGVVVVAEDLIESSLFQRITLPADDDDIMPPKDGPLAKNEIDLIKNWIANGLKEEAEVRPVEVAKAEETEAKGSAVFVEFVLPIFRDNCVDCHGADKQKGKLRLDSIDWVAKGAGGDAILVAGKPDDSAIYERITLPADHDDRMPPKGDMLTKAQTDLIKLWITSGGN